VGFPHICKTFTLGTPHTLVEFTCPLFFLPSHPLPLPLPHVLCPFTATPPLPTSHTLLTQHTTPAMHTFYFRAMQDTHTHTHTYPFSPHTHMGSTFTCCFHLPYTLYACCQHHCRVSAPTPSFRDLPHYHYGTTCSADGTAAFTTYRGTGGRTPKRPHPPLPSHSVSATTPPPSPFPFPQLPHISHLPMLPLLLTYPGLHTTHFLSLHTFGTHRTAVAYQPTTAFVGELQTNPARSRAPAHGGALPFLSQQTIGRLPASPAPDLAGFLISLLALPQCHTAVRPPPPPPPYTGAIPLVWLGPDAGRTPVPGASSGRGRQPARPERGRDWRLQAARFPGPAHHRPLYARTTLQRATRYFHSPPPRTHATCRTYHLHACAARLATCTLRTLRFTRLLTFALRA